MNILKIKLSPFSLLIILMVSVFVISCQQEAIKPQIDDKVLIQKMADDADIVNFVEAYHVYENELIERIKANRELQEDMKTKKDIALSKYPTLLDVFEEVFMIISGTTNTVTERCSESFRDCSWDCEDDFQCSIACWWWWCDSAGF